MKGSWGIHFSVAIALSLSLGGCGSSSDYEDTEEAELSADDGSDEDTDGAIDRYGYGASSYDEERGDETYDEFDQRRDQLGSSYGTFGGYGCTVDCSGHEAGYEWAQQNGISETYQCGGNSWSFIEGCKAYVEEQGGY